MRPLPHPPDGAPGKAGTPLHRGSQPLGRHQLDLRRSMDVDKLNKQVMNRALLHPRFELRKLRFEIRHVSFVLRESNESIPTFRVCQARPIGAWTRSPARSMIVAYLFRV